VLFRSTGQIGGYKKVRFDTDAKSCKDFVEMKTVETDTAQFGYRPDLRAYDAQDMEVRKRYGKS